MRNFADSPSRVRLCRCRGPVIDDETCILCGRYLAAPTGEEQPTEGPPKPPWTRAGVVRAMRAFVFFHDRPPSATEWLGQPGSTWPTARAVEMLFGSFDAGLAAAGVAAGRARR
jgi:hypothetical protein